MLQWLLNFKTRAIVSPGAGEVMSSVVLIAGTGRCGIVSLLNVFSKQPSTWTTLEDVPLLPWRKAAGERVMRERMARFRKTRDSNFLVDGASFYLPYLEDAIAADPEVRVIGLTRPREEVVASFGRFLDEYNTFPTNHWAEDPSTGWSHDLIWTRTMPQYPVVDRAEGIRRYWDEYSSRLDALAKRYPQNVRVFAMYVALNSEAGQREVLTFAGYPPQNQLLDVGRLARRVKPLPVRPPARYGSKHLVDPGRCAVLVPFTGSIFPQCEHGLRELEKRGYEVRRIGGYAAIDQARNQMATDALVDGFEETMWIDSDIEFDPDTVDQLRTHDLPIVCGIYAQKGRKAVAAHVVPGTPALTFGLEGGLVEILYAATGFLLVRREVYLKIQHRSALPLTNERFGEPLIPFFCPMAHPYQDGHWYLAEDYAFSERAKQCGFSIVADTRIRLWHIGTYPFAWEDAGSEKARNASFTLHLSE
jgi:hypothetical protein